jgi:hypothetical protein
VRQQLQERHDSRRIEGKVRRELPQNRSKVDAQPQQAGGQETGERRPDVTQPADMGDRAWRPDREHEVGRHLFGPARERVRTLHAIERVVDLDGPQVAAAWASSCSRLTSLGQKVPRQGA